MLSCFLNSLLRWQISEFSQKKTSPTCYYICWENISNTAKCCSFRRWIIENRLKPGLIHMIVISLEGKCFNPFESNCWRGKLKLHYALRLFIYWIFLKNQSRWGQKSRGKIPKQARGENNLYYPSRVKLAATAGSKLTAKIALYRENVIEKNVPAFVLLVPFELNKCAVCSAN